MLDAEVGNSTHTEDFQAVAPERFVQLFIAEQAMVGAQTGLQALGKTAFAGTFGAFLSRAADFVRMGAISRADLRLFGSHAGVSIGEDGPSQMAVEDLAMFRALHGSTVLYPADGHATINLVTTMCDLPGISYLRTTREATPVIYGTDEEFPVGGSKTVRTSGDDSVTLIGAGVTLHTCLEAADALANEGIAARVIDAYSVKPIDATTIRRALEETGILVVAEDHRVEGGIGDAVLDAIATTGPAQRFGHQAGGHGDAGLGHGRPDARVGRHRRCDDRGAGASGGRSSLIRSADGHRRMRSGDATQGQRDDLFRRHGPREQVALTQLAPTLDQESQLCLGLDAFSQGRHPQAARQFQERADDAGRRRIGVGVAHERPVDLQHADRHLAETRQRRVAGTEVVDRDPQTARVQLREDLLAPGPGPSSPRSP